MSKQLSKKAALAAIKKLRVQKRVAEADAKEEKRRVDAREKKLRQKKKKQNKKIAAAKSIEKKIAEIEKVHSVISASTLTSFQADTEEAIMESVMFDNINKARASVGLGPLIPITDHVDHVDHVECETVAKLPVRRRLIFD